MTRTREDIETGMRKAGIDKENTYMYKYGISLYSMKIVY